MSALNPEIISSEILKLLISAASDYLGEPVTKAVVTVPAYFMPNQCAATERAGKLAGLEKIKLLREPEAAALAYGLTQKNDQVILVFDLGGGTFDVSILEIGIHMLTHSCHSVILTHAYSFTHAYSLMLTHSRRGRICGSNSNKWRFVLRW